MTPRMSSAFVREGDDMWLHEIPPTMDALITFLSRENGIRIIEKQSYYSETEQATVHQMSDGFKYLVKDSKWVCLD